MGISIDEKTIVDMIKHLIHWNTKLNTLLYLELVLKPLNGYSYIHIGGERETAYIPVYKVGGEPYIPISSVYGALRRIVEAIVKSSIGSVSSDVERMFIASHCELEDKAIRHICSNDPQYLVNIEKLINIVFDKDIERYFVTQEMKTEIQVAVNRAVESMKVEAIPSSIETLLSFLCPICRLVGGPGVKSRISILNIKPHVETLAIETKTSVNRALGTVHPGHLYSIESLALHGIEIAMVVRNVKPGSTEAKILKALITYMRDIGIFIGGRKTVGLGIFKVDVNESRGIYIDLESIDPRAPNSAEKFIRAIIAPETLSKQPLENIIDDLDK